MYMDPNIQLAESVGRHRVLLERAPDFEPPPRLLILTQVDHGTRIRRRTKRARKSCHMSLGMLLQWCMEVVTRWMDGDWDQHAGTRAVTEEVFRGLDDYMVFPLRPQPGDDCLHYVSVTTWVMGLGMIPIVVDAKQCRGTRFVVHVGAEVSKENF